MPLARFNRKVFTEKVIRLVGSAEGWRIRKWTKIKNFIKPKRNKKIDFE